ncbi:hypothetical protein ACFPK5_01110 [Streptomyces beijiangensis]|uniref:hypothetical protein n=1 Tax=Streptomyces beijiangensis TaxID=163361 RepID=UPI003622F3E1
MRWVQGDMPLAAQAFGAARAEGEEHGKSGEAAMSQAMRAFTLAFTTEATTDDEIDLAEHLLAQVDLRAATWTHGSQPSCATPAPTRQSRTGYRSWQRRSARPDCSSCKPSWSWRAPSTTPSATTGQASPLPSASSVS